MKKLFFLAIISIITCNQCKAYTYNGSQWNKTYLTYYINNSASNMTSEECELAIQEAFSVWDLASVFSFEQVGSPLGADITLHWVSGNHGDQENFDGEGVILAHTNINDTDGIITYAEIHFDDDEDWAYGQGHYYELKRTAIHEIGHVLGLGHTTSITSVMNPSYIWLSYYISGDDIKGVGDLYGFPFTLSGPTVPGASSCYSIPGLFVGCSVSWNYTGTSLLSNSYYPNSPTNSTCTINNPNKQYINGLLTATIGHNSDGTTLKTLSMPIKTGINFSGTYSQLGGQVIGPLGGTTFYDPIPTTSFSDNSTLMVHRVHTITITSPMFSTSTLSPEVGSFPTGWNQNGNTITYNFPRIGGPAMVSVIGRSNTGYDVFKFTVGLEPDFVFPVMGMNLSSEDDYLIVDFVMKGVADTPDKENEEEYEIPLDTYSEFFFGRIWNITVVNILTGKVVYQGNLEGPSLIIPTKEWESGVYTVRAFSENDNMTGKISIKKR